MKIVSRGQENSLGDVEVIQHAEINGAALAYVERGTGKPVVLAHGALSDYRTWSLQVEALSEQYHPVAYSLRYHYPNEWADNADDYSRALHAADLIAFLRALELGPVHLVGHSYGGALAAWVAKTHPELVRSLVLGEPSLASILTAPVGEALLAEQTREFEETLQFFEQGNHEHAVREYLRIMVGMDVFDQLPGVAQAVIMNNARTLGPMLRTFYVGLPFSRDDARKMKVPTLLITGSRSPKLYRLITAELAACLPNGQVVVLDGASHGLQIEQPIEFNRAVNQFLSSQR